MNVHMPMNWSRHRAACAAGWAVVASLLCVASPAWSADAAADELERDLLGKLREHLDAKQRDDPMARAGDRMRQVQKRLAGGDGGNKTREMQKQIVNDLEEAIKRMRQQCRSPNSSNQKNKTKKVLQKARQPRRQPGQQAQKPTGAGRQPAQQPGRGTVRQSETRPAVGARAEDWGFLPDVLREEVLQRFKEGYLQAYRHLLEQYYISLSEKGRSRATSP